MAISSRFSVAVHVLSMLLPKESSAVSTEFIAGSVNTEPEVIRRILSMLTRAGLVIPSNDLRDATLARPLVDITLLDVYKAVHIDIADDLFSLHSNPNPDCPVGRNIQDTLEFVFDRAQSALERELASISMAQIAADLVNRASAH